MNYVKYRTVREQGFPFFLPSFAPSFSLLFVYFNSVKLHPNVDLFTYKEEKSFFKSYVIEEVYWAIRSLVIIRVLLQSVVRLMMISVFRLKCRFRFHYSAKRRANDDHHQSFIKLTVMKTAAETTNCSNYFHCN